MYAKIWVHLSQFVVTDEHCMQWSDFNLKPGKTHWLWLALLWVMELVGNPNSEEDNPTQTKGKRVVYMSILKLNLHSWVSCSTSDLPAASCWWCWGNTPLFSWWYLGVFLALVFHSRENTTIFCRDEVAFLSFIFLCPCLCFFSFCCSVLCGTWELDSGPT